MRRPVRRSSCLLLIVARAPVPGETKTRLGTTIGMVRAARLHRAFLADLAHRFTPRTNGQRRFDLGWAYAPAGYDFAGEMAEIAPQMGTDDAWLVPQTGDNFADRLMSLFRWSQTQSYERTLILASDSPHLPFEYMPLGFDLLARSDVVLGRVADGGYYVIGMRGVHEVVSPAVMSTADAANDLVAAAKAIGLRVAELPTSFDVDTEADLEPLIRTLRADPGAARATWRALHELGLATAPSTSAPSEPVLRT